MAIRKNKPKSVEVDFVNPAKIIEDVEMGSHLEKSFLEYAYLVILQRALPDARDGLIPSRRRILYTMNRLGLQCDKKHVKSARIVGEVMGVFHPHGSSYGTLVGMAQDFNMRVPLVDGHGNFGSVSDGPAADRYTESRLSRASDFMLEEIKEKAVDMKPNYDATTEEPVLLPAQFPNLLINGSGGIAVGMANKMPPHNPKEVIDATRWLLKNPEATIDKLMSFVPAPDFPTAGIIIGIDGIHEAYKTGRGKFYIRARHQIEPMQRGKNRIVFTEMPYETSVESVIESLKKGMDSGKIVGVADAIDLTDKDHGIRFEIETKAGINPNVLVETLFKLTPLQISYNINNTVITPNDSPAELGLKELLQIFIDFRIETVIRRTQSRLDKREHRLHQIDALKRVLLDIDKAIKIIRNSANPDEARTGLMKSFKLDEEQADYVMNMQLRRLTKFDRVELDNEEAKLSKEVVELKEILGNREVLIKLIDDELKETAKVIGTPRLTEVMGVNLDEHMKETKQLVAQASVEIKDEPCVVSLSTGGQLVRNAKPARGAVSTVETTTRGRFGIVTNKGRMFRVDTLHVGEKASKAEAVLPTSLERGERILTITPVELSKDNVGGIAMGTRSGVVKIQNPSGFPKTQDEYSVFTLADGDEILGARWVEDTSKYDFVFINSNTNMLRMNASTVRPQGALTGTGVAGFKFDAGTDEILDFSVVSHEEIEAGALVVSVADSGNAKFTPLSEYPTKGRGTGGVRTLKFLKGETKLVYTTISVGAPKLKTADGETLEVLPLDMRRDGSGKPLGGVPVKG